MWRNPQMSAWLNVQLYSARKLNSCSGMRRLTTRRKFELIFLLYSRFWTQSPLPKSKTRSPMIIALHPKQIKRCIPEQLWKSFCNSSNYKSLTTAQLFLNMYMSSCASNYWSHFKVWCTCGPTFKNDDHHYIYYLLRVICRFVKGSDAFCAFFN